MTHEATQTGAAAAGDFGIAPLWWPDPTAIGRTNLGRLMSRVDASSLDEVHSWSVQEPAAFWTMTIEALGIRFDKGYDQVLDLSSGPSKAKWFTGGRLNIAANCLERASSDRAIITRRWNGGIEVITIGELATMSRRAASGFVRKGVRPGDGVAIMMMMTVEAIAAYLGVVLMGGYVVSIPESLPEPEVRTRLRIGGARLIVTQDVLPRAGKTHPIYERLVSSGAPPAVVIPSGAHIEISLRSGDDWWASFLGDDGMLEPALREPDDCINVLFSSGTTDEPKAIPWDHTTPIKAASDAHWHHDLKPDDVVSWPTSLGWMMGPWLVFAGLLNRATIAIYEGSPIERGFCEFVQDAKVSVLGLVPSIVRGWRRGETPNGLDWSCIRMFSSSGEASDPEDYEYLMRLGGPSGATCPVIEYCGGTELGGGYLASTLLTPNAPSTFNAKVMGTDFVVLTGDGRNCKPGEVGEVFLIPPAIGMTTRLVNLDNDAVYYAGCKSVGAVPLRKHGDLLAVLDEGRYRSLGRADDTMNLGGIKTSSAEIEQAVSGVEGVIEVAAVGVPPAGGGPDRLILFVVVGSELANELHDRLQRVIRNQVNPLFHVHEVVVQESLPRTASNKLIRRQLRSEYQRRQGWVTPK